MCEICCADTPKKRKAVSDFLLSRAEVFDRLAGHYRALAHGSVKPHEESEVWKRAKAAGVTALRTIVEDLL